MDKELNELMLSIIGHCQLDHKNQTSIVAAIAKLHIPRRERIAIAAMQGFCMVDGCPIDEIASLAVETADALIAELDKEEK